MARRGNPYVSQIFESNPNSVNRPVTRPGYTSGTSGGVATGYANPNVNYGQNRPDLLPPPGYVWQQQSNGSWKLLQSLPPSNPSNPPPNTITFPGNGLGAPGVPPPGSSSTINNLPPGPPGTGNVALDPDLAAAHAALQQILSDNQAFNTGQRTDAISLLLGGVNSQGQSVTGFNQQIKDFYDPFYAETEKLLPQNPFSDEFRGKLMSRANDLITTQGGGAFESAEASLASRGLSSGGTTSQTAGGGIISDMLNARVGAETETRGAQLDFNTKANARRQEILGTIRGQETNALGQLTTLASQIEAGNVIDPMGSVNILGQAITTQLSREDRDAMLEWIATQAPTVWEQLAGLIPLGVTALFPGAQNAQAAAGAIFGNYSNQGNYGNPFAGMQSSGFNVFGG